MTILTICTIIAAILYLGSGMAIIGSMKGEGSGASSLIRWPVLAGLVMQGYALHGECSAKVQSTSDSASRCPKCSFLR